MLNDKRIKIMSIAMLLALLVVVIPTSGILAASPSGTGQPNKSCEDAGVTPGHSASAPGSAFNPNGVAGSMYAGEQPQNSINPHSVSQYDVACFQLAQH